MCQLTYIHFLSGGDVDNSYWTTDEEHVKKFIDGSLSPDYVVFDPTWDSENKVFEDNLERMIVRLGKDYVLVKNFDSIEIWRSNQ